MDKLYYNEDSLESFEDDGLGMSDDMDTDPDEDDDGGLGDFDEE